MKIIADQNYVVYILTNKNKSVLYTGITNNLKRRLYEHRNPEPWSNAFTTKYRCYYLIYYEIYLSVESAIAREKQVKGYSRRKKESLISELNENWDFLNDTV